MSDNAMDRYPRHSDVDIRTVLYRASRKYPAAIEALAYVASLLEVDISEHGSHIAGWPVGTHPPELGGGR